MTPRLRYGRPVYETAPADAFDVGVKERSGQAVHLASFSVVGFRSLRDVQDIPVSSPTILAGQNDGGKSAVLAALSFLVGNYRFVDDDRTYADAATAPAGTAKRCDETWVEGTFTLDAWEQAKFGYTSTVRVRRFVDQDGVQRLQLWAPVPDDERLHDLPALTAAQLKKLASEFAVTSVSTLKSDLLAALTAYAQDNASEYGWVTLQPDLAKRMPSVLAFDGKSADPEHEARAALVGRYETHMDDESITGPLAAIEDDVRERVRGDAASLREHIRGRCPDLVVVDVEPDVSFRHGLQRVNLRLSKTIGESVAMDRTGQGCARRVALAVWEWNSGMLAAKASSGGDITSLPESEDTPPPLQTIVVYDEPDTHLDYEHQRKIMRLIREQSEIPNVNVIVATHSMNLIDGVDIVDVVHLKLVGGRTVVERLGSDTHEHIDLHLGEIAASLGLRNTVLLHERCFLAVEGETEQQAFPLLFRRSEGLSLQAAGIALWACGNNEGALILAGYLTKHGRAVMLVVDADSQNKAMFKSDRLAKTFGWDKVDDSVKLLGKKDENNNAECNELEELFSDALWAEVANTIWPSNEPWTPQHFATHRGGKFSAGVQEMLQAGSENGPGGKPAMMAGLAAALTSPDQVPLQLRDTFKRLRSMADGNG